MKISARTLALAFAVTLFVGAPLAAAVAQEEDPSQDRHAGYYYPEPETTETYTARVVTLPDSDPHYYRSRNYRCGTHSPRER